MIKTQDGTKGDAYRSLLGEAHRYPQLLARFESQVLEPRFNAFIELLKDAAARGEISPERSMPVVLEILHAFIVERLLLGTGRLGEEDVAEIVDQALLPLLGK